MKLLPKSFTRPIIIASCILIGGLLITGCGNSPKVTTSATTFKEAQILYDLGKNQEALAFFNQKLSNNSTDFASFITRGKILAKLGRYDDAINDFYKASKLDNNKSTYMLYKGLVTMQSAVDVNALDALDLSGTENMDMFTFYKCALFYQLNKTNDAGVCLDKLMAIDNNNPQGNFLKGMTLVKTGKYKDSIKYFDKAEAGGLETQALRSNKGIALSKMELSGAVIYLDKALALNSNDTGALYAKAFALFSAESYRDGMSCIDRAISMNVKNKDYRILKGDFLMRLGNYVQAIAAYTQALSLDDKDSNILAKKAVAEYKAGDVKSMEATILQAKDVVTINKYLNFSIALIRMSKYNDAMVYIDQTLAANPNNTSIKFAKAFDSYLLGNLSDADSRYTSLRANKMVPYEAKIVMANYLVGNDDFAGASKLIEEVLKVDPTNEMAHATKVKLYIEMTKAGKSVSDSSFDYTTPDVVNNALSKLGKYWFLKSYR
ncbi:MAG: tetratricopeptide repeat protein [candidate division SR1 bacterium]|nr:tetratricopeptide repeat protein [candidate division SR1 bacterium]